MTSEQSTKGKMKRQCSYKRRVKGFGGILCCILDKGHLKDTDHAFSVGEKELSLALEAERKS